MRLFSQHAGHTSSFHQRLHYFPSEWRALQQGDSLKRSDLLAGVLNKPDAAGGEEKRNITVLQRCPSSDIPISIGEMSGKSIAFLHFQGNKYRLMY